MPTLTVWVAGESRTDFGLNAGPTLGAAMEFSEDQGRRTRRRGGMNARAKPGAKRAMGPNWQSGCQGTLAASHSAEALETKAPSDPELTAQFGLLWGLWFPTGALPRRSNSLHWREQVSLMVTSQGQERTALPRTRS